jgi:hypothetical protein
MTTHRNRPAKAAMVAVAASVLSVAAATSASAAPSPRLPNADLFCPGSTLTQGQWASVPGSDSLWIFTGPLAGHYVIVTDTHYLVEGYQEKPPTSYDPKTMVDTKTWGAKTGLTDPVRCDFVSRWGEKGDPETVSVIGPIAMVRVSG